MFTYEHYRNIISQFKEKGFRFSFFGDNTDMISPTVFLRHDVDIDCFGVVALASIEEDLGVRSTWYFMPNNEIYNIMNKQVKDIIWNLSISSHQIGLHIDASVYDTTEALIEDIEYMYQFFSRYLPLSKTVSFHMPAKSILGDIRIPDFSCPYEHRFFNEISFVSDSSGRRFWLETRMNDALTDLRSIQILTHPIWWKETERCSDELENYLISITKENFLIPAFSVYRDARKLNWNE